MTTSRGVICLRSVGFTNDLVRSKDLGGVLFDELGHFFDKD